MKKMFRKITAMTMAMAMLLSFGMTVLAIEEKYPSNLHPAIIEQLKQLESEMNAKGYILTSVTTGNTQMRGNIAYDKVELTPYNGYEMYSQLVVSDFTRTGEIATGSAILDALANCIKIIIGKAERAVEFTLGDLLNLFDAANAETRDSDELYEDTTVLISTNFLMIEDKLNKVPDSSNPEDDGFYPYGQVESRRYTTGIKLSQHRGQTITYGTNYKNGTFYSDHWGNMNWLKQMAYNNYMSTYPIAEAFEYVE